MEVMRIQRSEGNAGGAPAPLLVPEMGVQRTADSTPRSSPSGPPMPYPNGDNLTQIEQALCVSSVICR